MRKQTNKQTLRDYYRVINWPNFNFVVSQGTGKPKERERNGEWPVNAALRTHITLKFAALCGHG